MNSSRVKEEKTMNEPQEAIKVLNLDHVGIVVGIIYSLSQKNEVRLGIGLCGHRA